MKPQSTTIDAVKKYPGRKGTCGHLQQIVSLIPKCDIFIEAMAGSAAISNFMRNHVATVVSNDINRSLPTERHSDYRSIVDEFDCTPRKIVVFYFDPPYMFETRSWKGKLYKHEWKNEDHETFLSRVLTVKSNCMISHYPCPLYETKLSVWRKHYYTAMTRAGKRIECVYMNYDQPKLLATTSAAGKNRTHRQQIKRKLQRLIKKIQSLPGPEQSVIATAIHNNFIDE